MWYPRAVKLKFEFWKETMSTSVHVSKDKCFRSALGKSQGLPHNQTIILESQPQLSKSAVWGSIAVR